MSAIAKVRRTVNGWFLIGKRLRCSKPFVGSSSLLAVLSFVASELSKSFSEIEMICLIAFQVARLMIQIVGPVSKRNSISR